MNEEINREDISSNELSNHETQDITAPKNKLLTVVVVIIAVLFIALGAFLGWKYPQIRAKLFATATPTSLPPTMTFTPTPPPTSTPLPTETPLPTANPYPASAFQVENIADIVPAIPGIAESAIILNDDLNLISNPELTDPQWVPSSSIGLDVQILEPYHATFNSAAVAWVMDTPLEPGLYELYILDTLYSSGGSLDFTVALGNQALQPVIGQPKVNYKSSYTTPPQTFDLWHSIGIYNIDQPGILSITSTWLNRDEYSVVAIDRALIAKLPDSTASFLNALPQTRQTYIMDNLNARITTRDTLYRQDDLPAWGDEFQFIVNPATSAQVIWDFPERVPVDQYEIFAWIPNVSGNAQVSYTFFVEGSTLGIEPVSIQHSVTPSGEWVSLGVWKIPEVYGESVAVSLQMDIPEGTAGEVAIDAVAIVQSP